MRVLLFMYNLLLALIVYWFHDLNKYIFILEAVFDRMRADQKKFGKTSWTAAVERMEKLQYGVSKETLQLMRAKEICLEQKKHALKEEVTVNWTFKGVSALGSAYL